MLCLLETYFSFCTVIIPHTLSVVNQNIRWSEARARWESTPRHWAALAEECGVKKKNWAGLSFYWTRGPVFFAVPLLPQSCFLFHNCTLNNALLDSLHSQSMLGFTRWPEEHIILLHSSLLICFCFFFLNQNFYHYVDSELLLGKPNESSVCCTLCSRVFTSQDSAELLL